MQPLPCSGIRRFENPGGRMLIICGLMFGGLAAAPLFDREPPNSNTSTKPRPTELSAAEISAASQLGHSLGIADWLGPMAPVALSPFFGITCLSGMALYGQGWVAVDNPLLGEMSPLRSSSVFYAFLVLTMLTSIPRLTKVSKPFAQAVDQVEAWAGIITLLTLKLMLKADTAPEAEMPVVQLGILSFTADTLLMVAAVINIFVINAVRFFFEVLVWITPVPAIDAIFEVMNKSVCAGLMVIYGYSPMTATAINLVMFVVAAMLFRWVYRREVFFRTVLLDALWSFLRIRNRIHKPELIVFPTQPIGPIAARSRCRLIRSDNGWTLTRPRLFRRDVIVELPNCDCRVELVTGYLTNSLRLVGVPAAVLTFSRRYNACLAELAQVLGAQWDESTAVSTDRSTDALRAEMG